MKKIKKVAYQVVCARNPEHVFEKAYSIEAGTEAKQTEVDVFCPFCQDYVTITVKGIVVPDAELLRKFKGDAAE